MENSLVLNQRNLTNITDDISKFNYDRNYHIELVNQIKDRLPENKILYAVETDGRGINHTHIITDTDKNTLNEIVTNTLLTFIEDPKEFELRTEKLIKKYGAIEYINKSSHSIGLK